MMETSETNFVKRYEPGNHARVELVNGVILDVVNSRDFDAGTSPILQGGMIESIPGLLGETRFTNMVFQGRLQTIPGLHVHQL